MEKFFTIALLLFWFGTTFGQEKGKPVYYDNWPTEIAANRDILKIKYSTTAKYVPIGSIWSKRILTYFFSNGTTDMSGDTERDAVRLGFTYWSNAAAVRFVEVCSATDADIIISWQVGNHGDDPFDGVGGIFAHAAGPPPHPFAGLIHFDDDEDWVDAIRTSSAQPIDLVTVAAHEIGHVLGLDHTTVSGSLMLANYTESHRYLGSDDLAGIVSLYGTTHEFISGADVVCSTASYSIVDYLPSSASVFWSSSNPSILSINSSTGSAARIGSSSGLVNIIATISTGCGSLQLTKAIWLGTPSLTKKINGIVGGTLPVNPGNLYNLTAESLSPSTTFNYNNYTGSGDMMIDLYTPSDPNTQMYVYATSTNGSRHVRVTATNACASYYEDFVFYIASFFKSIYPNPVKNYLVVEFNDLASTDILPVM